MGKLYLYSALFGVFMGLVSGALLITEEKHPALKLGKHSISTKIVIMAVNAILFPAVYGWFLSPLRVEYVDTFGKTLAMGAVIFVPFALIVLAFGLLLKKKDNEGD